MNVRIYNDSFAHLKDELSLLEVLLEVRFLENSIPGDRVPTASPRNRDLAREPQTAKIEEGSRSATAMKKESPAHTHVEPVDPIFARGRRVFLRSFSTRRLETLRARFLRMRRCANERIQHSLTAGVYLALPHLSALFHLSEFETAALLVCLAPDLDTKYETMYGRVLNVSGRQRPAPDLILALLSEDATDRLRSRVFLSAGAPLLREGLLMELPEDFKAAGSNDLGRLLRVAPRILNFLLLNNEIDHAIFSLTRYFACQIGETDPVAAEHVWPAQGKTGEYLKALITGHALRLHGPHARPLFINLHGPYGSVVRGHLSQFCAVLEMNCLEIDLSLFSEQPNPGRLLRIAAREAVLQNALLHLTDTKAFADRPTLLHAFARDIDRLNLTVVCTSSDALQTRGIFERAAVCEIAVTFPDFALRKSAWSRELKEIPDTDPGWAEELAGRYDLTPGQIEDAGAELNTTRDTLGPLSFTAVCQAARAQARHDLRKLAFHIPTGPTYDYLVLPPDVLEHLHEISAQMRNRFRVFDEWGYSERLGYGRGLSILFAGPPGTGKTLAAQVIAGELELDLFKVDLSRVLSKYIGETEQNLSRIFDQAKYSNALLFFDEADALFGKRTSIGDAHDRYANIETGYLLQKMEDYDGAVILASNFRDNVDEAFLRRIRFILEFPFPDAEARSRIWRSHFPEKTPTHELDYEYLGRKLQLAGGSIKNVALNAAFLAIRNGENAVTMDHVLHCARRELEKIGQLWVSPESPPVVSLNQNGNQDTAQNGKYL